MKNASNFEAFKLNKTQMNAVTGGANCHFRIRLGNGDFIYEDGTYYGMSKDQASQAIHDKYDSIWGAENVLVSC